MLLNYLFFSIIIIWLLIIVLFALWKSWRFCWRPVIEKIYLNRYLKNFPSNKNLKQTLLLLLSLYSEINSKSISLKERERLAIEDPAFIYGEIDFLSFFTILTKVKPTPKEIFYDLGCGAGKAVFSAILFFDIAKAYGIELLPALYNVANSQIEKAKTLIRSYDNDLAQSYLQRVSNIQFINDDFLNCNISDADIIFINATCLNYHTWEALIEKLMLIKVGSRIIVTTKKIHRAQFQLLYHGLELMSWGMNSVNIYIKTQ